MANPDAAYKWVEKRFSQIIYLEDAALSGHNVEVVFRIDAESM